MIALSALLPTASMAAPAPEQLAVQATQALRHAAGFFRDTLAVHGSYVWRYSTDLTYRRGEGLTTPSQGWVQPPGTPAVGLAYLEAYQATDDRYYLDAAVDAAHALAATQLQSGGWFYRIEFDPQARKAWCYRLPPGGCTDGEITPQAKENRERDATTIDDNVSQSASNC